MKKADSENEEQDFFSRIIHLFGSFFIFGGDTSKVKQGKKMLRKKKFDKAIELFYEALAENNNDKEAYIGIGDALQGQNVQQNHKEAIACYQKSVNIDNFFDLGYERIIDAYMKVDDRKKAMEERRRYSVMKMLRENPENPVMNNNMGIFLLRQNRFQQAINHFQKSIICDPTFQTAYVNLAVALFKFGSSENNLNTSHKYFEKAVDAVDRSSKFGLQLPALLIKIRSLIRLKKFDQALKTCNEAKKIDPSEKQIYALESTIVKNKTEFENERTSFKSFDLKNQKDQSRKMDAPNIIDDSDF